MNKKDNLEYNKSWRTKHYDVYKSNSIKSNAFKSIRQSELRLFKIDTKIETLSNVVPNDDLEAKFIEYSIMLELDRKKKILSKIEQKKGIVGKSG
jgi:hypothetical protein